MRGAARFFAAFLIGLIVIPYLWDFLAHLFFKEEIELPRCAVCGKDAPFIGSDGKRYCLEHLRVRHD